MDVENVLFHYSDNCWQLHPAHQISTATSHKGRQVHLIIELRYIDINAGMESPIPLIWRWGEGGEVGKGWDQGRGEVWRGDYNSTA